MRQAEELLQCDDRTELRAIFNHLDSDGDGAIDLNELKRIFLEISGHVERTRFSPASVSVRVIMTRHTPYAGTSAPPSRS